MGINSKKVKSCNYCKSNQLKQIYSFGKQPLANALTNDIISEEKKFYLKLLICKKCYLVQLSEIINPKLMFKQYTWVTGTSVKSQEHCKNLANLIKRRVNKSTFSILGVASNDATFLKNFQSDNLRKVVGIDPAVNFQSCYGKKMHFINDFFNNKSANQILKKYGTFDVIVARNVFSHIPDAHEVFKSVAKLLNDDGLFYIEFHWLVKILKELHYDSIYHEHSFYHSVNSISSFLGDYNLYPYYAFESPISGGSIVLEARKNVSKPTKELKLLTKKEKQSGITNLEAWRKFAEKVDYNLDSLSRVIKNNSNRKIAAFGVSARSSTILNAIGKEATRIIEIADNNSAKWNKFTPGTKIPIVSVSQMVNKNPDLIIVFPFNFEAEIIHQLRELKWSGELVFPLPKKIRTIKI